MSSLTNAAIAVGAFWGAAAFVRCFLLQNQLNSHRQRIERLEEIAREDGRIP